MIDRATFEAESRHLEHDDDPLEDQRDVLFSWRRDLPFLLLLMLAWGGLTAFTQFAGQPSVDAGGAFHVAVAEKMVQHGVMMESFPWMTQTVWVRDYFDKDWLFHVALAFSLLFGTTLGPKLLLILINSLIPVAAWYTARHLGIRKPLLWLLFLPFCTFSVFWVRQQQTQPHVLGLLLLMVCLGAILKRQKRFLAAATFFFVLSSADYWQVILLALVADLIWSNLDEHGRPRTPTWEFPMLGTAFLAAVVGSVMHPNFPHNISGIYYLKALEFKSYFDTDSSLALLRAESPVELSRGALLLGITPLLICLLATLGHALRKGLLQSRPVLLFGIATLSYLVVTLFEPRFITYMQPVVLLFLVAYLDQRRGAAYVPRRSGLRLAGIVALVVVALASLGLNTVMRPPSPPSPDGPLPFAGAAAWIRANLAPGEAVFHTHWQDAAPLFYAAPNQRYLVAQNVFDMYAFDANAFERWYRIRQGRSRDPVEDIHRQFDSRVVFAYAPRNDAPLEQDRPRSALYEQLHADPRARLVYGPGPRQEVIFLLDLPPVVPPADAMIPKLSSATQAPPVLDPSLNPDAPTRPSEIDPHYRPTYTPPQQPPRMAPSTPEAEREARSTRPPLPMTGEELDKQLQFQNEIRERLGTQPDSTDSLNLLKEMGISLDGLPPPDAATSPQDSQTAPQDPQTAPLTPDEQQLLNEIREQRRREVESPNSTP